MRARGGGELPIFFSLRMVLISGDGAVMIRVLLKLWWRCGAAGAARAALRRRGTRVSGCPLAGARGVRGAVSPPKRIGGLKAGLSDFRNASLVFWPQRLSTTPLGWRPPSRERRGSW